MKYIAFGLIAVVTVLVWFAGQTSEVKAHGLFGAMALGLLALALVSVLSSHCSVRDLLFLSEPWHHCPGMVPGYGLFIYGVVGLIKRAVTHD